MRFSWTGLAGAGVLALLLATPAQVKKPSGTPFPNGGRIAVVGGLCDSIDVCGRVFDLVRIALAKKGDFAIVSFEHLVAGWGQKFLDYPATSEEADAPAAPKRIEARFAEIADADSFLVISLDNFRVEQSLLVQKKCVDIRAVLFDAKTGRRLWGFSDKASVFPSQPADWPKKGLWVLPAKVGEHDPIADEAAEKLVKAIAR